MKKHFIHSLVILGILIFSALLTILNLYLLHMYLKPYLYAHQNEFKHESVEFFTSAVSLTVQFWGAILIGTIARKILINQRIIKEKK